MTQDYQGHILGPQLEQIPSRLKSLTKDCTDMTSVIMAAQRKADNNAQDLQSAFSRRLSSDIANITAILGN